MGFFSGTSSREPQPKEYPRRAEDFLKWVDFQALNDVFHDQQRSLGVRQPKKISRSRVGVEIVQGTVDGMRGKHSRDEKWDTLYLSSDDFRTNPEQATRNALHTLVHEKKHGISNKVDGPGREEFGLSVKILDEGDRYEYGSDINEIVTEVGAVSLLNDFYRRKGMTEFDSARGDKSAYLVERKAFEPMILLIAETLGQTREQVWTEIEKAYLLGSQNSALSGIFMPGGPLELHSLMYGIWDEETAERFLNAEFKAKISAQIIEAVKK